MVHISRVLVETMERTAVLSGCDRTPKGYHEFAATHRVHSRGFS